MFHLRIAQQRVEHLDLRLRLRAHEEGAQQLHRGAQLATGQLREGTRAPHGFGRTRAALDDERLHVRELLIGALHVLLVQLLERRRESLDEILACLQIGDGGQLAAEAGAHIHLERQEPRRARGVALGEEPLQVLEDALVHLTRNDRRGRRVALDR